MRKVWGVWLGKVGAAERGRGGGQVVNWLTRIGGLETSLKESVLRGSSKIETTLSSVVSDSHEGIKLVSNRNPLLSWLLTGSHSFGYCMRGGM